MKPILEYLSTKVALPKTIKATDETIQQIVKDELDCLGHDCDLNHIDVSQVTDMNRLFSCANNKFSLGSKYEDLNPDISKWDVSKVETMESMFYHCKNFNQDISQWNVSNVENMWCMFYHCKNFNQDLSKWDISKVVDMQHMFCKCENFNQDLSCWDLSNGKHYEFMFDGCPIKKEFKPKFKK